MIKKLILILFGTGLGITLGEITLRSVGFYPFNPKSVYQEFEPKGFIIKDTLLGYSGKSGDYISTINKRLSTPLTFLPDGSRITSFKKIEVNPADQLNIHLYGCSFTFGMNLPDNETMAWKLQEKIPEKDIKNFAFPGYGLNQMYLKLEANLKRGIVPDILILNYASFHDSRNIISRENSKMFAFFDLEKTPLVSIDLPKFRLKGDTLVKVNHPLNNYYKWPFMSSSSIVHLLEASYNKMELKLNNAPKVSFLLIKKILELSKKYKFKFVLGGIDKDEKTTTILTLANKKLGIETVNISVNHYDKKYNLKPFDTHPNALANDHYAEKLFRFLTKQ